jgi:hypothetical protein
MQKSEPVHGNISDALGADAKRVEEAARLIALERTARSQAKNDGLVGRPGGKKRMPKRRVKGDPQKRSPSWASRRKAMAKRAKRSRKRNR